MRQGQALFLLLVFASASGAAQNAPTDPAARSATGRWSVTFDIPQQQYRTIVELAASANGGLTATNLGYPLLQFKEGTLAGNQLLLKGTSTYGLFEIRATLAGDRFDGRWQVAFLGGDVHGVRDSAARPGRSRLQVFDEVWAAIDRRFYDPRFNGVDWRGARARYRPQAAVALTDAALVTVIRKMLGELRSSHLGFSALPLQESFVASAAKPAAVPPPPITWRTIAPGVGYIQIKQFEEGQEIVASVDRAFAEVGGLASLVIDVRGNPGGTLSAAMRLGDYLFAEKRTVGFFVTRRGLRRFHAPSVERIDVTRLPVYTGYNVLDFKRELDRSGAVAIATGGRAQAYRGRVVLLIDERCGSTTEGFAAIVKDTHAAALIGRRTAGAMLSSVEVPIAGSWTLRLPEADFRTPMGTRVEGVGVEPDVVVPRSGAGDPDLDRALTYLQAGRLAPLDTGFEGDLSPSPRRAGTTPSTVSALPSPVFWRFSMPWPTRAAGLLAETVRNEPDANVDFDPAKPGERGREILDSTGPTHVGWRLTTTSVKSSS